jgi:hypothetical protein
MLNLLDLGDPVLGAIACALERAVPSAIECVTKLESIRARYMMHLTCPQMRDAVPLACRRSDLDRLWTYVQHCSDYGKEEHAKQTLCTLATSEEMIVRLLQLTHGAAMGHLMTPLHSLGLSDEQRQQLADMALYEFLQYEQRRQVEVSDQPYSERMRLFHEYTAYASGILKYMGTTQIIDVCRRFDTFPELRSYKLDNCIVTAQLINKCDDVHGRYHYHPMLTPEMIEGTSSGLDDVYEALSLGSAAVVEAVLRVNASKINQCLAMIVAKRFPHVLLASPHHRLIDWAKELREDGGRDDRLLLAIDNGFNDGSMVVELAQLGYSVGLGRLLRTSRGSEKFARYVTQHLYSMGYIAAADDIADEYEL